MQTSWSHRLRFLECLMHPLALLGYSTRSLSRSLSRRQLSTPTFLFASAFFPYVSRSGESSSQVKRGLIFLVFFFLHLLLHSLVQKNGGGALVGIHGSWGGRGCLILPSLLCRSAPGVKPCMYIYTLHASWFNFLVNLSYYIHFF